MNVENFFKDTLFVDEYGRMWNIKCYKDDGNPVLKLTHDDLELFVDSYEKINNIWHFSGSGNFYYKSVTIKGKLYTAV